MLFIAQTQKNAGTETGEDDRGVKEIEINVNTYFWMCLY